MLIFVSFFTEFVFQISGAKRSRLEFYRLNYNNSQNVNLAIASIIVPGVFLSCYMLRGYMLLTRTMRNAQGQRS